MIYKVSFSRSFRYANEDRHPTVLLLLPQSSDSFLFSLPIALSITYRRPLENAVKAKEEKKKRELSIFNATSSSHKYTQMQLLLIFLCVTLW